MRHEPDERDLVFVDERLAAGAARFAPFFVVAAVVGGFVWLAWYAYHAGMQSVDADLLVVEADKTPMKEKPIDPGGMQFPNQDKTVFETFSGNAQPPKVERVLPRPEEPMPKDIDTSGTSTWVNPNHSAPAAEPVIAPPAPKPEEKAQEPPPQTHQVIAAKPADHGNETYVAPSPDEALDTSVKAPSDALEDKPAPKPAVQEAPKPAKEEAAKPAGNHKIQLGAYRSEKEAREAWDKMRLKQKDLSDKKGMIVRADLGEKGVFFRLRVGGLESAADARDLCKALVAKGQSCLVPAEKK